MQVIKPVALLCLLTFSTATVLSQSPRSSSTKRSSEAKLTTFAEFEDAIRIHRGKIVVVYFWAGYNVPSIQEYVRYEKMHKRLGPKGIVTITVCMSSQIDLDQKQWIETLLSKLQTSLPCFLPSDDAYSWEKKLKIQSNPAVILIDRRGRIFARLDLFQAEPPLIRRTEELLEKLFADK